MLPGVLLLAFSLANFAQAQYCLPGASNAFQVRISLKTALGDNAYVWDQSEEYLFQSMVAFAMRSHLQDETFNASNVQLCNVTRRISFWFVVTNSSDGSVVPASEVEMAIRKKRERINSAFLLNDNTLDFVKIIPTLTPPAESSITVWLVVFGVIFGLVLVAMAFLIVSGILQRKAKKRVPREIKDSEDNTETEVTIQNRIYSDTVDSKGGQANGVYVHDDGEQLTPL